MTSPEDPQPAGTNSEINAVPGGEEKGRSKNESEGIPGWAFMMRPLRRKGGKSGSSANETPNAPAARGRDTSAAKGPEPQVTSQPEDDRDSAQSKGSGYGLRHTETLQEVTSEDGLLREERPQGRAPGAGEGNDIPQSGGNAPADGSQAAEGPRFKVYKRRWFGVVQLVLLNTIVSWDVSYRVPPQDTPHFIHSTC